MSSRPIEIPAEIKDRLLREGKMILEKLNHKKGIEDEYEFMHLNSVSMGLLAIAKEFSDFRIPKKIIDSLYTEIRSFEKEKPVRWPHSKNRIFINKIILSILNEKYLDQSK